MLPLLLEHAEVTPGVRGAGGESSSKCWTAWGVPWPEVPLLLPRERRGPVSARQGVGKSCAWMAGVPSNCCIFEFDGVVIAEDMIARLQVLPSLTVLPWGRCLPSYRR